MKDSQQDRPGENVLDKYIKESNERFSTTIVSVVGTV